MSPLLAGAGGVLRRNLHKSAEFGDAENVGAVEDRMNRENFDLVIGRLDRVLSEFLCLYDAALDEPDRQTLKHHADDLIGVGKKMHSELSKTPENGADIDSARAEFLRNNPPWI